MTRQGPRKAVGPDHWRGRQDSARDHLERARDAITLAKPAQDARAIVSLIVLAAIAYADALTANRAQIVNQQDHAKAPRDGCWNPASGSCHCTPPQSAVPNPQPPSMRISCPVI